MTQLFLWALTILSILLFMYSRAYTMKLLSRVIKNQQGIKRECYKLKRDCLKELMIYCTVILISTNAVNLLRRGHEHIAFTILGTTAYLVYLLCVILGVKSIWEVVKVVQYRIERKY